MSNPFNSEVSNANKTEGGGVMTKRGPGAAKQVLRMKTTNWPGLPGGTGPSHGTKVPVVKIYAQAKGVKG